MKIVVLEIEGMAAWHVQLKYYQKVSLAAMYFYMIHILRIILKLTLTIAILIAARLLTTKSRLTKFELYLWI